MFVFDYLRWQGDIDVTGGEDWLGIAHSERAQLLDGIVELRRDVRKGHIGVIVECGNEIFRCEQPACVGIESGAKLGDAVTRQAHAYSGSMSSKAGEQFTTGFQCVQQMETANGTT